MNYYNGFLFKGFIDGVASEILSGGQYDNMMKKINRTSSAIGFAIYLDLLDKKYHEAFEKKIGIYGSSYTNTMMIDLGVKLYFAEGSDRNIKLTTPDDLAIFEAMLNKNA